MKKGVVFSIEAGYAVIVAILVLIALLTFMKTVNQPNYDLISSMKVAHDMGEEGTIIAPEGFDFGSACDPNDDSAFYLVYDYDSTAEERKVCTK